MASREDEKRRRRQERLDAERRAATAARRQRLLRLGGTAVLAVVLIVGVVVVIATGGSSTKTSAGGDGAAPPVDLPAPKESNLQAAARESGCVLRDFPSFGQEHTSDPVTYKTNPPTSGPHNPQPAQDGAYSPDNPPEVSQAVHALEHGRIELQWKPGVSRRTIGQLQSLYNEQDGYHVLLFENQTNMPFAVAAIAWQHLIGCKQVTPATVDALRDFRETYTDKAPERVS